MKGRVYRRELVQGAINLHKISFQKHFKFLHIKLLGDGTVGAAAGSMAVPAKNIVSISRILSIKGYFRCGPKNGSKIHSQRNKRELKEVKKQKNMNTCRLYPPRLGHSWRIQKSFVPTAVLLTFLSDTSQPCLHRRPTSAPIHPLPDINKTIKPQ